MTDEDLIRAFFIYDFPRVFYAEQGQGSVKLITCNSLHICRFQRLKGQKIRNQGMHTKNGTKNGSRVFYDRAQYKYKFT